MQAHNDVKPAILLFNDQGVSLSQIVSGGLGRRARRYRPVVVTDAWPRVACTKGWTPRDQDYEKRQTKRHTHATDQRKRQAVERLSAYGKQVEKHVASQEVCHNIVTMESKKFG
jgi:succinylarginine dihydrolase